MPKLRQLATLSFRRSSWYRSCWRCLPSFKTYGNGDFHLQFPFLAEHTKISPCDLHCLFLIQTFCRAGSPLHLDPCNSRSMSIRLMISETLQAQARGNPSCRIKASYSNPFEHHNHDSCWPCRAWASLLCFAVPSLWDIMFLSLEFQSLISPFTVSFPWCSRLTCFIIERTDTITCMALQYHSHLTAWARAAQDRENPPSLRKLQENVRRIEYNHSSEIPPEMDLLFYWVVTPLLTSVDLQLFTTTRIWPWIWQSQGLWAGGVWQEVFQYFR